MLKKQLTPFNNAKIQFMFYWDWLFYTKEIAYLLKNAKTENDLNIKARNGLVGGLIVHWLIPSSFVILYYMHFGNNLLHAISLFLIIFFWSMLIFRGFLKKKIPHLHYGDLLIGEISSSRKPKFLDKRFTLTLLIVSMRLSYKDSEYTIHEKIHKQWVYEAIKNIPAGKKILIVFDIKSRKNGTVYNEKELSRLCISLKRLRELNKKAREMQREFNNDVI
jgi:hypothetical protein